MKGTRQWNERRRAMAEACGYRCWYCGRVVTLEMSASRTGAAATIDHQHPRDHGGDNSPDNLVIACFVCNSRKGTLTVEEYRSYLVSCQPASRLIRAMDAAVQAGMEASEEIVAARLWTLGQVRPVTFHGEQP